VGGGGNDTLEGGEGDDTFQAGNHAQQIDGGAGMDRLIIDLSGFAGDLVWNNDPTQTATLANGVTMTGIEALTLTTGAGNDELRNTMVVASDSLSTGDGDDVIDAGGGNDTVIAGAGDDVIYQRDAGSDDVDGGDGTDTLVVDFSGETQEYFVGNRGIWSFYYDAQGNYLNRSGAGGYEVVAPDNTARWGINSAHYSVTYSEIEHLDVTGTQYADFLLGGVNADVLRGGAGNDVFVGGGGNDTLEGGEGDDTFQAGNHAQQIDGGAGMDRLIIDLSGFAGDLVWNNDPTQTATLANGVTMTGIEALTLTTGAGNDELRNTMVVASDSLSTGDGDDVIDAGGGNDTVIAGAGDDVIYQRDAGSDDVDGGDGTDTLVVDFSGETQEYFVGNRGIWSFYYDAQGNYLNRSGAGGYEVVAPDNTARWGINSAHYSVTYSEIEHLDVTGTQYADFLLGGVNADVLRGGAGNDVFVGGGGNDTLEGGEGDDTFQAGNHAQQIDGGAGMDRLIIDLSGFAGDLVWNNDPTQTATLANGVTMTGIEALTLTTGAGNDELRNTMVVASDSLSTGDGDDVIDAGGGNDTVIAGAGDDVIYQRDAGSDDVDGGDGTDTLVVDFSGETQEYFVGNRGIWSFYYDAQGNYLNRSGAGGYEVVAPDNTARWGINSAHYSVTYSEIEHLDVTGTQYADFLLGGVNADVLRGGAGNDVFVGGGGNDTLEGGEGDDTFQAGNHAQQIDGGAGMDRLIIDLSGFAGDLVWNNDPTQTATLANGVTMTGIEALTLTTGAGNDELRNTMVVASDSLSTGDGDDVIDAGGGNDTVIAGAGDDVIYQRDAGSDDVDGGDGTDTLVVDFSGETQEYFVGNRGIWSFYYDAQGNYLNRSGAGGYEVVAPDNTARWGINSAHYSVTYSEIEHLDVTGTQYADFLLGGVNADVLRGGAGNDVFCGWWRQRHAGRGRG
jgi:Ca2+-binding RTX toxin-like protein